MSLAMKPSSNGEIAPLRLAATVLLVRDGAHGVQVFMVTRHRKIEFASGALVFPGGGVDPGDRALAGDDVERISRVAAVRETYEECGVLLARRRDGGALAAASASLFYERVNAENLELSLDALTLFAHWITPPILPKRFDTRFYIVDAPADQTAVHDGGEAVDSIWIEPRRALEEAARGRYALVLPTRLNLELLGQSETAAQAIAAATSRRVAPIEPIAEKTANGYRLTIPADAGYGGPHFDV
ncbi:MAG TPA: NUDIX domain-containing protein [Roseiarcus sp.]|nr:NUDIX domain-containing protein [Roseiarcus sp.]